MNLKFFYKLIFLPNYILTIWQLKKKNQVKKVKENKRHLLIMLIKEISSASFTRRRDTSRRVVPNLRLNLKRKVISYL